MTTTTTTSTSNGAGTPARILSIDVRPDGVAILTYDIPGEPVNTLKASFAEEFERVFGEALSDPKIKAAVLVSGKPDTWIAGADLDVFSK